MNIRQAQATDSFALSALLTELGYSDTETFIDARLAQLSSHPDEVLLVAEHGSQVLGVSLSALYSATGACWRFCPSFSYFCIAEGERSKGSGQQLLSHAEQLARNEVAIVWKCIATLRA